MKLHTPNCPACGQPARGTIDTLHAVALLTTPDAHGRCDYAGETKIDWDSQATVDGPEGFALTCPNGHDWKSRIDFD